MIANILYIFFFLSFTNCIDSKYFVKLEINQTLEVLNWDYYIYFNPIKDYNFIEINLYTYLSKQAIYSRYYDTDDLTEIMENPPSTKNYNETNYYEIDTNIYVYYPQDSNIKTICFKIDSNYILFDIYMNIRRAHFFEVKGDNELDLENVFYNIYHLNRIDLKNEEYFGFYSKNNKIRYLTGNSKTKSIYDGTLSIVQPSNADEQAFIIIENRVEPIHLSVKRFDPEQYKIFTWSQKIISFSVEKEVCPKTILGIYYERYNSRSAIDYLKGYGDINMYLSHNIENL